MWHDFRRQVWRALAREIVHNSDAHPVLTKITEGFASSPGSLFGYVQPTIDCDLMDFKRYVRVLSQVQINFLFNFFLLFYYIHTELAQRVMVANGFVGSTIISPDGKHVRQP